MTYNTMLVLCAQHTDLIFLYVKNDQCLNRFLIQIDVPSTIGITNCNW